jgi:DNA-directed RNA polymerase subunit RPC12/RpoP
MTREDFTEVGHTGGKVTFTIICDSQGQLKYQIGYSHSSPRPASLVGIYAHPDGFACGNIDMGGIGTSWNAPPFPNCIAVMMASDSHGRFGHECPSCKKHFRSDNIPSKFLLTCPYCGVRAESYHFLTPPQKVYISHYVDSLYKAIDEAEADTTREVVIDMDFLADSVTDDPRPDFYYTSTAQQTEFKCSACNSYNDIRGKYGYCSSCGWRNSAEQQRVALEQIRSNLKSGGVSATDAVKQAVSEFDAAARDYVTQLISLVPMKESRSNQLETLLFHNIDKFEELLSKFFDISLLNGMAADRSFVNKMFCRRHIYEHDGGVATRRYVEKSGDTDIEEGDLIRETVDNAHKLIGCLNRMIATFETDFQEIFPPEEFCIEIEKERKERVGKRNA